jgi:hypothetical protein
MGLNSYPGFFLGSGSPIPGQLTAGAREVRRSEERIARRSKKSRTATDRRTGGTRGFGVQVESTTDPDIDGD